MLCDLGIEKPLSDLRPPTSHLVWPGALPDRFCLGMVGWWLLSSIPSLLPHWTLGEVKILEGMAAQPLVIALLLLILRVCFLLYFSISVAAAFFSA